MKKFILILLCCVIFTSCADNTVVDVQSSSDISSEIISSEIVSSTIVATKNLSDIADAISESFSLRDSVLADAKVLEGMTGITPEMYVDFSGKISCALDNFDTVMVFFTSTQEQLTNLEEMLSKAKDKYAQLHVDNLKSELQNSVIYSQDGYVFWIVAKDTTNAIETITGLL